ncbi:hypothetical protein VPH35_018937 [Triticum aestivum]
MAATPGSSSCLVGPVPFKDCWRRFAPAEEYADIITDMPAITVRAGHLMRQWQGAWLPHRRVPGVLSFQRRFTPRPDDVLLASPPKCGTTWLKALSFATMARAAYPPGDGDHPLLRLNPHDCVPLVDSLFSAGQETKLDALPSPRLMNTHVHHSLLPPSVAHSPGCKIVYVCREPKDMLVSLWHFYKSSETTDGSTYTFSDLFENACEGKHSNGPIWDHILGYWPASQATPGRVLFLRYEEMLRDPIDNVRELARFLGVPSTVTEEAAGLLEDIVKLCNIETLRASPAFPHTSFFAKGVAGDWVNHMTPEMAQRFNAIVEEKLHGSGLFLKS